MRVYYVVCVNARGESVLCECENVCECKCVCDMITQYMKL